MFEFGERNYMGTQKTFYSFDISMYFKQFAISIILWSVINFNCEYL